MFPAGNWTYSHDRQVQINPASHPDLTTALERLWASEVTANIMAIAMQQGVAQAVRVTMGATLAYAITNDTEGFNRYRRPTTASDLIVSDADPKDLRELATAMERLRARP
jgi:hypothetical protein